uniref:Uncharacterized protein n=2 Tax=Nothobranchius korthausae TaxID=1143690 RepID=A0A1A8ES57_9TELE
MSLSRKYIWMIVILGMVASSMVIVFIFLLINKCVFRTGKHNIQQLQRKADSEPQSNKYQERNVDCRNPTPPLPSPTQFFTAEAQSYENLAEEPDYEQIPEYEQITDHQLDYVKVENGSDILHSPSFYNNPNPQIKACNYVGQSDENLAENDYEESVDQPDYVQADDEADPGPSFKSGGLLGQSCRNLSDDHDYEESVDEPDYEQVEDEKTLPSHSADPDSGEDYDDIGEDDDEDYDDVM